MPFICLSDLAGATASLMVRLESGQWQCTVCNMISSKKSNIEAHVEAKHVESGGWQCEICHKFCPSKNAYRVDYHRYHK